MKLSNDIFYKKTDAGILITSCNHEKVFHIKDLEEKIFLALISDTEFQNKLQEIAEEENYDESELKDFAEKFIQELKELKVLS